ncbi:MAG: hypothetical protein ACXVZR_11635 [Terriglobales bacterium]
MIDQVGTAFETRDAQPSLQRHGRTYSLFGLAISSAVPLPCPVLHGHSVAPDIELYEASERQISSFFTGPPTTIDDNDFWKCHLFADGATYACWCNRFEFAVSGDGRRVLWRKLVEVPNEVLFTYLLGHVMSFCLLARGLEQLHATAVVIDGAAIALLGGCGFGKSTLAAALLSRGYPLLTDDVLVLEFQERSVLARPSLPRVKLMPESAPELFHGLQAIPMNHLTAKLIFELKPAQHFAQKIPLRSIYMLPRRPASSSTISVRRVRGRASFLPLIRNCFNDTVTRPERLKQQFVFATRVAGLVPIKRLSYPKRLDLLPSVVDALVADAKRSSLR